MKAEVNKDCAILPLKGLTIKVQPRTHYGVERLYPVGYLSESLVSIAGRKTWTNELLDKFEALGVKIEHIPSSIEVPK